VSYVKTTAATLKIGVNINKLYICVYLYSLKNEVQDILVDMTYRGIIEMLLGS